MTTMTLKRVQEQEIKSLRADARRLTLIAKHLRDRASGLARQLKLDERGERARTNFFSKQARVDSDTVLTPELGIDLFVGRTEAQ